jgi:hypothetical protein
MYLRLSSNTFFLLRHICSAELLKIWNEREASLVAEEGTDAEKTLCGCLATRPLAVSNQLQYYI